MRITGLSAYQYRLRLEEPLRLKGSVLAYREGLLLRLVSADGMEGWGEVAPLLGFSREGLPAAGDELRALQRGWQDVVWDAARPQARDALLQRLVGGRVLPASVRFGLELALVHLQAAAHGCSLSEVLFEAPRDAVLLNGLLVGEPEEVLQEARRMQAAGYRAVKLKVGRAPVEEEAALVRTLSDELGEAVGLRLDANRAWTWDEAVRFARATEGCPYDYLEEPLADPGALPDLSRRHGVPVALDESLLELRDEGLEEHRYARAVVLKPTLLGGLHRTLRLARRAAGLGMTPVVSAAFEAGVGTRGLVALASGIGTEDVPVGLDTYRRLAEDVLHPSLDLRAPRIDVDRLMHTERAVDHNVLREL